MCNMPALSTSRSHENGVSKLFVLLPGHNTLMKLCLLFLLFTTKRSNLFIFVYEILTSYIIDFFPPCQISLLYGSHMPHLCATVEYVMNKRIEYPGATVCKYS